MIPFFPSSQCLQIYNNICIGLCQTYSYRDHTAWINNIETKCQRVRVCVLWVFWPNGKNPPSKPISPRMGGFIYS